MVLCMRRKARFSSFTAGIGANRHYYNKMVINMHNCKLFDTPAGQVYNEYIDQETIGYYYNSLYFTGLIQTENLHIAEWDSGGIAFTYSTNSAGVTSAIPVGIVRGQSQQQGIYTSAKNIYNYTNVD